MKTCGALVRAFLATSPLGDEEFGQLVLGDPKFVANIDNGRPLTLQVADRLLRFMGETPIGPTFRRRGSRPTSRSPA